MLTDSSRVDAAIIYLELNSDFYIYSRITFLWLTGGGGVVDVVGGGSRLFILSALNLHVFVADQGVHGDEVACRHQGLDGRTKQDEYK